MRNNLIASELNQKESFKNRKDFYSSLAYPAMMPFHHLLSAQEIYSSIFDQSPKADISEENSSKDEIPPAKLQRLIQEAALKQNSDNTDPVTLDDCISAEFFEPDDEGEQFKTSWMVPFRGSSFQGSAEIYRAEMFLFKRLICERRENLGDIFILTDNDFSKYLDYEIFERLTSDKPEILLLNSLTSLYQISVMPPDDIKNSNETANNSESKSDEQNSQSNYDSTGEDVKKFLHSHTKSITNTSILTERIHSWKSILVASDEKSDHISNSLFDIRHAATELSNGNIDSSDDSSDESNLITLYKLNLGSYWRKWQQAAQTVELDFDLLEKLEDVRAIRFYELTKFLRLELFDETTRSLPNELEIEYKHFTKLMPLPKFWAVDEIKRQIFDLIESLETVDYIKSFSVKANPKNKLNQTLSFQFNK